MTKVRHSVPGRLRRWWLSGHWVALALFCLAGVARAQTLPVAGDQDNLWIIIRTDKSFSIEHRAGSDPPNTRQHAFDFTGDLRPGGLAASGNQLWMAYQPGLVVQSVEYVPDAPPGLLPYNEPRLRPSLPAGTALRSLAVGTQGAWALVTVSGAEVDATQPASQPATQAATQSAQAFNQLPAILRSRPEAIRDILGSALNGGGQASTQPAPASQPAATAPATQSQTVAMSQPATQAATQADGPALPPASLSPRLLHLQGLAWQGVDLPADWAGDAAGAWLIMLHPQDERPVLVTATVSAEGTDVAVYRFNAEGWHRQDYHLSLRTEMVPVGVDGKLVVGQGAGEVTAPVVRLALLEGPDVQVLGDLPLPTGSHADWGLVPQGQSVALVTYSPGSLAWSKLSLGLHGNVVPAAPLIERQSTPFYMMPGNLLQMVILVGAMLVMFLFWRRDSEANAAKLPEGMIAADLVRRAIAAAIDLLPCVALACIIFRLAPRDFLTDHWPRSIAGWPDMLPGLVAIALFVVYGFLAELFTACTLGKRLLGLRVVGVDGTPPNLWQVLARNTFKAFDLIALPLLVLPFMRPHGQRLGDMVARTLVVQPRPPAQEEGSDEDGEE